MMRIGFRASLTGATGALFVSVLLVSAFCSSVSFAQTAGSDGPLTATFDDQDPPNSVALGQPVTYTLTIVNNDTAEGDIGTHVQVYIDGVLENADSGAFTSTGCIVDSLFPSAWACGARSSGSPQEVVTLTWSSPIAGSHDLRFEVIAQRPVDNDWFDEHNFPDFFVNLFTQTVIENLAPALDAIFNMQSPANPVPSGQPVNYTLTAVNTDPSGGAVGWFIRVYVNGVPQKTDGTAFDVPGCVADFMFFNAWACTELTASQPQQTVTLIWISPIAGSHDLRFEVFGQRPIDNDGVDFSVDLFAQTVTENLAPTLDAIGNQTVAEGGVLVIPLSATDPDPNDILLFSQTGLPAFCNLTNNGDRTGSIDCSPNVGDIGTSITVTVTDNGTPAESDEETFDLVVTPGVTPTVSISVLGVAGTVISVADTDALVGESVTMDGSATDAQGGDLPPDSFRWFVNGEEVTDAAGQASPTLRLPIDGDNTVTLEVSDSSGLTAQATATITVEPLTPGDGPISGRPGLTPNEKEAAVGLETTCGNIQSAGNPTDQQQELLGVCSILASDSSSDSDVAEALTAISGEQITSQVSTSVDLASVQLSNIGSRLTALRTLGLQASRGISTAGLNINIDIDGRPVPVAALTEMASSLLRGGGASADESGPGAESDQSSVFALSDPRLGIFINGNVAFGDKDQTDNETGFDFDSRGLTIGVDYLFTDHFVAGFAVGYGNAEAEFVGNTGEQESDFLSGTLFGTFVDDRWFLSAIAGYATGDYDLERRISASLLTVDSVAQGSTDGNTVFGGLSAEYDFGSGPWRFGPAVAVNFIDADIDGFSETGAGGLNLIYGDQTAKSVTARAGLRLGHVFSTQIGVLSLDGRADFVKELEDDVQRININFINDPFVNDPNQPSPGFTVLTDEPDNDYGIWGVSLSYQGPHSISGFIDYQSVTSLTGISLGEVTLGLRIQQQFR